MKGDLGNVSKGLLVAGMSYHVVREKWECLKLPMGTSKRWALRNNVEWVFVSERKEAGKVEGK